jgi:hypothetical protein
MNVRFGRHEPRIPTQNREEPMIGSKFGTLASLLLGRDAIQVIRAELDGQRAELEAWQETSLSTDFPM